MEFVRGDFKLLYIKEGLNYFPIGCLTSNSFEESAEMIETTTRDNEGWNTSKPTNQSYSITFDGLITQDLTSTTVITYGVIKQLKRDRTLIDWKIEDDNGNLDYGKGFFSALSDTAELESFTSFSGTIEGYGKPIEPISELFDAYEERVLQGGGEITSELCQMAFIKELIKI